MTPYDHSSSHQTGDADSSVLPGDLLGAPQTVMSAEDFSKYEKIATPPSEEEWTKEREQLLWEKVQSQNRLRKQEAGHVEQIAKLEADAAKRRTMLQGVREQLEAVNDEVCALRTLVADPSVPSDPLPEPPPLPRVPLLLRKRRTFWTLLDLLIKKWKVVNEDELEWQPVRRLAHWDRRNKLGVIKGYTKQRQEKRLRASKHVILEDDELSEHTGNDLQSGKEIADMLCNMSQEKLLEVAQNCPASMLQKFVPNVSAALAPTVVSKPASFSGQRVQTPGREPGQKRHAVLKFPFWAVMLVPGQQRLTVFCVLRPHPV